MGGYFKSEYGYFDREIWSEKDTLVSVGRSNNSFLHFGDRSKHDFREYFSGGRSDNFDFE